MDGGAAARHSAGAASDEVRRTDERIEACIQADGEGRATGRTQSGGAQGAAASADFARHASFAAEEDPSGGTGVAPDRKAAASAAGRPSGTCGGAALGPLEAA